MHAPEFERLCHGLCAVFGLERQQIEHRQNGLQVFRLFVHETDVYLLHAPTMDEQTASVVIECGTFPHADEQQGWLDLLDANYSFHGAFAPRFSRDPETGGVILQCAFGLLGTAAAEVHPRVLEMIRIARDWRAQHPRRTP